MWKIKCIIDWRFAVVSMNKLMVRWMNKWTDKWLENQRDGERNGERECEREHERERERYGRERRESRGRRIEDR